MLPGKKLIFAVLESYILIRPAGIRRAGKVIV